MNPLRSISTCPICGGGLCGIRFCRGPHSVDPRPDAIEPAADEWNSGEASNSELQSPPLDPVITPHGLVVCDECEAIWRQPDVASPHSYADPEHPLCPICGVPLWSDRCSWAGDEEIAELGWADAVDHSLDMPPQPGNP